MNDEKIRFAKRTQKPALDILNGRLGFYPKDYNRDETDKERLERINEYYNSKK